MLHQTGQSERARGRGRRQPSPSVGRAAHPTHPDSSYGREGTNLARPRAYV